MVIKLTRSPPSRRPWWRTSAHRIGREDQGRAPALGVDVLTTFLIQSAPQLLPTIADIFS